MVIVGERRGEEAWLSEALLIVGGANSCRGGAKSRCVAVEYEYDYY